MDLVNTAASNVVACLWVKLSWSASLESFRPAMPDWPAMPDRPETPDRLEMPEMPTTGPQITAVNATMPALQDQPSSTSPGRALLPLPDWQTLPEASSHPENQASSSSGPASMAKAICHPEHHQIGSCSDPKSTYSSGRLSRIQTSWSEKTVTRGPTTSHRSRCGWSAPWTTPSLLSPHLLGNHQLLRHCCRQLDFSKLVDTSQCSIVKTAYTV